MIKIERLTKTYPGNKDATLKEVSFTVSDTGLYYLVGKSGSGKSTLLNIIGGMDDDYQGEVIIDGLNLKELSEKEKADFRYKYISFVFQDYKADEKETVLANLLKPLAISDMPQSDKVKLIEENLKRVGLSDKLKANFSDLSGGEKKRISLVRGLIKETPILLADEPLASLNKNMRNDITELLVKESKKRAVLVITHEEKEIPPSAEVLRITNGKLTVERSITVSASTLVVAKPRKKFKGTDFSSQLFNNLRGKRQFLVVAIASLVIALFSITFSFLLSGSVSSSLESTLTSYMSSNSLVLSEKDDSYNGTEFESADYHFLNSLKERYSDIVLDTSNFYITSANDIFMNNQAFTLSYLSRNYQIDKLSCQSFLDALLTSEIDDSIYGKTETGVEEVILGLDDETIAALHLLLFNETLEQLDEITFEEMGKMLANQVISLRIQLNKGEWQYYLDHSYRLVGFFRCDKVVVANDDVNFNSYFLTDTMHFKEVLKEEEMNEEEPWTLKYVPGLILKSNSSGEFLNRFLNDSACNRYVPQVLSDFTGYLKDDYSSYNRIIIYKDYLPKLTIDKINGYVSKIRSSVEEVLYSSHIYTYTASGYIAGFQKPFFFASNLEKLNYISDSYRLSDTDLGSFQSSLIEVDDKVIKADLLSVLEEDGLTFKCLNDDSLLAGRTPKNESEIVISKSLATQLFSSLEKALNSYLYALTLVRTEKEGDGYKNIFADGRLTIVGIKDDEDLAIYQEALFPLCYAFSHFQLYPEETRIDQAVIKVDLDSHDTSYYLDELADADLTGSFPIANVLAEIEKTLDMLANIFLVFSILGLITSSFLLFLALYLIQNKDRKSLGTLLALGYYKSEINRFYFAISLTVGLISYLLSVVLSIFAELMMRNTLVDMLDSYSFSPLPYLISLLSCLLSVTITALALTRKLSALSPKDAFLKR